MTTATKTQQAEALDMLQDWIKPGEHVFSVWRGTSASGMTHWFDFYLIQSNQPHRLTALMCTALGYTYDTRREALKTQGCGMDMAFQAVYNLGMALWPDGTPEPHSLRNGKPDTCGGYAIKHRSMG